MKYVYYFLLFIMAYGCKNAPSKKGAFSNGDTLQLVWEKHGDTTYRYTIHKGKNTDSVWYLSGWDTSQAYIRARWPKYYYIGGIKGNRFNDSTVAVEFTEWLKKRDKNYNPSVGRLYNNGDAGIDLPQSAGWVNFDKWDKPKSKSHRKVTKKHRKHKYVRVGQGYNSIYTRDVDKKKMEEWLEIGWQDSGINTISNVRGTSLITEESVLIAPTRNGGRLKIKMNLPDSSLTISGDTTGIVNTLYDFIVKQNTH